MSKASILMARRKSIALAAHDHRKEELVQWAKDNLNVLRDHSLYATRAKGQLLKHRLGLNVTLLEFGRLGGDQQIGSRISEGLIDFVILFSDPLQVQPHDTDVKALLRITVVWNIPVACNRASADFIISSPLMSTGYEWVIPDYSKYRGRLLVGSLSKPHGRGSEGRRRASGLGISGGYSSPNNDMQTTAVRADQ
jgi:methylglyoxal synthase